MPAVHHELLPAKQAPCVQQLCLASWHQNDRPTISQRPHKGLSGHLQGDMGPDSLKPRRDSSLLAQATRLHAWMMSHGIST